MILTCRRLQGRNVVGGKNLNDCEIKIETPKLDFGDMEKGDVV